MHKLYIYSFLEKNILCIKDQIKMKTLILGASLKPNRYSNLAINKFIEEKYDVVGVGLEEGKIGDVRIFTGMPKFDNIQTITIYMNAQNQEAYYDYIISLKPKRVIFNPGTYNLKLQDILMDHGIAFENACTLVLLGTRQF